MSVLPLVSSRRRRPTCVLLLVAAVFAFLYTSNRVFSASPTSIPSAGSGREDRPPSEGSSQGQNKQEEDDIHMDYGTSSRPNFDGYGKLTKLGKLSEEHLPAQGNNKRLIIIGDVHGMITPLKALLAKVGFNAESGNDHLIFVGNMVSEGPDSAAVVDLAQSVKASGVRGVHEDRVLLAREASYADQDAFDDLQQQHLSHGDYDDRIVAESLSPQNIEYLSSFPVILELGYIPTLQNAFVVHAGLVPGLELEKQDPWPAMHMRSVVYPRDAARRQKAKKKVEEDIKNSDTWFGFVSRKSKQALIDEEYEKTKRPWDRDLALPVDDYSGEDWAKAWDVVEGSRSEADRRTVFYGHDTRNGLNIGTNAIGLNSKCVYGGQLSAFVITGSASGVEHETVQVDCEQEAKLVDD
ncbi:hypothetical protein VUR80DRAFT_216 [Thermomyces stellatus]